MATQRTVARAATIDLNDALVLVRVVEARSFTEAARKLGLPKSTVSRRVTRLEESLGVRLLQRTTRKLALTEAGARWHDAAVEALGRIEEATAAVSRETVCPRGMVRLTAPVDVGVMGLPRALARFVARWPEVRIETVLTNRMVDLVAEGFDLALRASLRPPDSTLVAKKIGHDAFVVVGAPSYLRRHGEPKSVRALARHACVLMHPRDGRARWVLLDAAGRAEAVEVTGPLGADELSFVRGAVKAGAGLGFLPPEAVREDVAKGRLVRVLPGHAGPPSTVSVVYPSARFLPHRVALLRDFLVTEMRERLV